MGLVIFFVLSMSSLMHELHLSITDIYYNEQAERIEIQQRIFIDDLELAIRKFAGDSSINILKPSTTENLDSIITAYLNTKNTFELNDQDYSFKLLEYDNNMEAFTFYCFISDISDLKSIRYHSAILFELYDDQTNIVSINAKGKKKSGRFNEGGKSLKIEF